MSKKKAISYSWANPLFVGKADPQRVHSELETLRRKDAEAGVIETDEVIEYAKTHARSELHKLFVWDDTEAAHLFRRETARKIVRSIRVIYPDQKDPEPVRVYLRPASGDGYMPMAAAPGTVGVDALRRQALTELMAWLRRYEQIIASLPGAKTIIDRMVVMLRQAVEPQVERSDAE